MLQVTCKQLGREQCSFTAFGKDAFEVTKMLYEHSIVEHKDELEAMTAEQGEEMNQKVLGLLDEQVLKREAEAEKLAAEEEARQAKLQAEQEPINDVEPVQEAAPEVSVQESKTDLPPPQEPSQIPK